METMAISKFKAKCLSVVERVRRNRKPILITRFGKPMAEVIPPRAPRARGNWMGQMRGTLRITGDIIGPASKLSDWEVLRS